MTESAPYNTAHTASDATNHERFCALVEPHIEAVGRFVHALVRNREEARDIVGDTLLTAFENVHLLKSERATASWLCSIARNIVYQRARRKKFWGVFDAAQAHERPSDVAQPDVSAEVALLHEALARLPEKQREALTLFEIVGLSLDEIHALQGGSLSGVKSRIARARETLKKKLR